MAGDTILIYTVLSAMTRTDMNKDNMWHFGSTDDNKQAFYYHTKAGKVIYSDYYDDYFPDK